MTTVAAAISKEDIQYSIQYAVHNCCIPVKNQKAWSIAKCEFSFTKWGNHPMATVTIKFRDGTTAEWTVVDEDGYVFAEPDYEVTRKQYERK